MTKSQIFQGSLDHRLTRIRVLGQHASACKHLIDQFLARSERFELKSQKSITVFLDSSPPEFADILTDPRHDTLILDLDHVELVRVAHDYPGVIRWFAQSDPRQYAQSLIEHYRGTYYQTDPATGRREMVYSGETQMEVYPLPEGFQPLPHWAGAVCAAREWGVPKECIRFDVGSSLQSSVQLSLGKSPSRPSANPSTEVEEIL
jgi:hypothetical protein